MEYISSIVSIRADSINMKSQYLEKRTLIEAEFRKEKRSKEKQSKLEIHDFEEST